MNEQELHRLLQQQYFDNIDRACSEQAVEAFVDDARWQHTQVWAHHGHDSRHTDRLVGRDRLLVFLNARVPQMQQIPIRHQVDQVILSGSRGAFRARVIGPDGRELGFLGWVETRGDRLQSYLVAPEDFAA